MLDFSSPANMARITSVLAAAILVFTAIAVLAREVTPCLGLALLAGLSVLGFSTPAAVASSALMVGALVVGLGISVVVMDPPVLYARSTLEDGESKQYTHAVRLNQQSRGAA
jgi:hypothetical protein